MIIVLMLMFNFVFELNEVKYQNMYMQVDFCVLYYKYCVLVLLKINLNKKILVKIFMGDRFW